MERAEAVAAYREIATDLNTYYPQQGFDDTLYEHIADWCVAKAATNKCQGASYSEIIAEAERFSSELTQGFEDYLEEVEYARTTYCLDKAYDGVPQGVVR